MFNSSTSDKTYSYGAGTGYGESEGSITVYANHYGASELRGALQNIAANTTYFTTAEQGLMNATTVTTADTKNNNTTYTTTDKLYALAGEKDVDTTIKAGTNNQTVLAMSSYWGSGNTFWLRSPENLEHVVLASSPGPFVVNGSTDNPFDVRPASNLDLTDVLFASAATGSAGGKINSAMALRLKFDGSNKAIGVAKYDAENECIIAKKDPDAESAVYIVI